MQILGICRFSYPAIGGFQVEHETVQDRIEYLYKDEILGFRLKTFELLTLPSIKGQTDKDFTLIVLIGESLPAYARDKLEALTNALPYVKIVALPPLPHREAALEAFAQFRDRSKYSVQFRLDDDDAVAHTFIETLREKAMDAIPMLADTNKVGIDFNQGYAVRFAKSGLQKALINRPYLTPALGILMRPRLEKTVLHFPHHRFAGLMPTLTFPNPPMYLRCFHDLNDSTQNKHAPQFPYQDLADDETEDFAETFGVDARAIKAWCASF